MNLTLRLEAGGPYDPHPNREEALALWAAFRQERGLSNSRASIITRPESQPKAKLNEIYTATLNLVAGSDNFCTNTEACEDTCVTHHSWRARSSMVQLARDTRAQFLVQHPHLFAAVLQWDVELLLRQHPTAMMRPNCNQDVAWEKVFPWLLDMLPMYDYTKRINRVGWVGSQYRVTYSATSFTREQAVRRLIDRGDTVTMVFPTKKHQVPDEWKGIQVIDGDVSDDRFNDPNGVIIGLSWKGKLRGKVGHPLLSSIA